MMWRKALLLLPSICAFAELRVAAFRADATPALGEPLIWTTPTKEVLDPLWVKGVVLADGSTRYVLAAIDWCGVGGETHMVLRRKIAVAAGARLPQVTFHSVHQHTAPYIDGDGYRFLSEHPDPPRRMSAAFLEQLGDRVSAAVAEAAGRLQVFDSIGVGEAEVDRVASARRLLVDGKLVIRFSGGGKDPAMAALPEGPIDRKLKTISFLRAGKPLVRLHYYATHPQTFCCDGRVSGDIVNAAREAFGKSEGVPQIYFTGAAGDVTVGKYNDGSERARRELAERLGRGMAEAVAASRPQAVSRIAWRTAKVRLPAKPAPDWKALKGDAAYRAAITAAFAARNEPIEVMALEMGPVRIVHLPGEPMLEFQKYAQGLLPKAFVAVAGYGDMSTGYLCTDEAHAQGGYEPGASNATAGTEEELKRAIRRLLGR
jgi:hypothetical protein